MKQQVITVAFSGVSKQANSYLIKKKVTIRPNLVGLLLVWVCCTI